MPEDDVLHVTALTPDPAATPEPQPDPVSEPAPAAPPADDAGEAQPEEHPADLETQGEDATAQAPAAPDGQPKKPSRGVQKALDRLTERATRAEQLAATLAEAMAKQQQQPQAAPAAAAPAPQADAEPSPTQFTSWDDYTKALSKWAGRQEARQELQTFFGGLAKVQQQNATEAQQAAVKQRIAQATEKAADRIPDWDDVLASDLPMPPVLERAVARAPDPALALHYLATHPDEHMKLVRMDPEAAAFVAGQLFAPARAPARSNAPPPAKTVGGRQGGANAYRDDFTPEQHKAWLSRQAKG